MANNNDRSISYKLKRQPIANSWLCSNMVLLYLSFRDPLVLLLSPYGDSEMARNRFLDEPSGKAEREDGSKWYAMGNTCSSVNEAGLVRVVDLCSKVDESMFVRIR